MSKLFQGIIHQMRDAVDRVIGVIDESGTVVSCSELGIIGEQGRASKRPSLIQRDWWSAAALPIGL